MDNEKRQSSPEEETSPPTDARFAPPTPSSALPPSDDAPPADVVPAPVPADDEDPAAALDALAQELSALGVGVDAPTGALPAAPDLAAFAAETEDFPHIERFPPLDDLDIDTALQAVNTLDTIVARHEAAEQFRQDERERLSAVLENPMPRPMPLELTRGSLPSLIPSLALIGMGAWLTFAYTTGNAPTPSSVAALLVGLFGLVLVLVWLASGRWYRGTLFFALWGLFSAGVVYGVSLTAWGAIAIAPLLIVAFGAALLFSALLARPLSGSLALAGVMSITAGATALSVLQGWVPLAVLNTMRAGWWAVALLVALILLLPLLARLRR